MRNKLSKRQFKAAALFFPAVLMLGALFFVQGNSQAAISSQGVQSEPMRQPEEIQMTFMTTITVNTVEDLTPEDIAESKDDNHTCTYTFGGGSIYAPANGSSAGLCTLRRAILEASIRPDSDRPILIQFDLPPGDENNSPSGTWTIELDKVMEELTRHNTTSDLGEVTIDGSTQPGIRGSGPGVIIDSGDTALEIASSDNVLRGLSWKNGGAIIVKIDADNTLIEDMWMGLTDDGLNVQFRDQSDFSRMATGGISLRTDNNTVQNNVITGSFAPAIFINGGSDDNRILNNYIGTRADGTIPAVSEVNKCNPSLSYDPALWYGGWGISLGGSRVEMTNNVILSMHILRTANATSPVALETSGADHMIKNNRIGVDVNGVDAGTCGNAINLIGSGHEVAENIIANTRVSFEEGEEATMFSRDSSFTFGQNLIYGNIVRDSPGKILIFSGNINESLKSFKPARITKIDGTTLTGTAHEDDPCPNCRIDLYLDDTDEFEEALVWLGTAMADANGDFTFEMSQPLTAGQGVRTMSTTTSSGVIGTFGPNTTSEASQLYTPITDITFDNSPSEGDTGVEYIINFQVLPLPVSLPITYTINITDEPSPIVASLDDRLAKVTYTWSQPGVKTIEVTADNGLSKVTKSHQVTITQNIPEGGISGMMQTAGPTSGTVGEAFEFAFSIQPADADTPIDILLEITGKPDVGGEISTTSFTYNSTGWSTPGTKTIKITADNGKNVFTQSFNIVIADPSMTMTPSPSTTPSGTTTPAPSATPGPSTTPSSSSDKFIYLPMVVR